MILKSFVFPLMVSTAEESFVHAISLVAFALKVTLLASSLLATAPLTVAILLYNDENTPGDRMDI